jgi:YD repeat-containing protein
LAQSNKSRTGGNATKKRNGQWTGIVRTGSGKKAMKKKLDVLWLVILASIVVLAVSVIGARAQEQTRFYGPDGRTIGTAAPYGNGSVRFYDAGGRTLGTATTSGSTTKFYDARGNRTGTATMPSHGGVRR